MTIDLSSLPYSRQTPPANFVSGDLKVSAFDISLTATGWAQWRGGLSFETLTPPKDCTGLPRLRWIRECVGELARGASLVVMEGLSFGSNQASAQERAGLAYLVRDLLWGRQQPFVLCPPSTLKKFACGKGNAEKNLVLREVYRRFGADVDNDNEADAVALCYLGRALIGDWQPETLAQREVLKVLRKSNAEALEMVHA